MNVDYKRTILKTTLWTVLSLIVVSVALMCLMIFVFPKTMADFCYSIGMEGSSANLYYANYQRNGDIYSIYKSLNIEIKHKNNDKIIKYYDTFVKDDEYSDFIVSYKQHNEGLNIGILEKSTLLNEENYLVNKYISALINTNQNSVAFNFAIELFKNYKDFTLEDQGVYAFSLLLSNNDFNRIPQNYELSLLESIQEYFNISVELFTANMNASSDLEKAYMISLGNRIIQVGQDLNTLYISQQKFANVDVNSTEMLKVNNFIKGLI